MCVCVFIRSGGTGGEGTRVGGRCETCIWAKNKGVGSGRGREEDAVG